MQRWPGDVRAVSAISVVQFADILEQSSAQLVDKQFVCSERYTERARMIAEKRGFREFLSRVPVSLGHRFADTGRYREAVALAVRSLEDMESGGYPVERHTAFTTSS